MAFRARDVFGTFEKRAPGLWDGQLGYAQLSQFSKTESDPGGQF